MKEKLIKKVEEKIMDDNPSYSWFFEKDNVEIVWIEDKGFAYLNYNQDNFDTADDGDLDTLLHHLSVDAMAEFLKERIKQ